MWAPTSLREGAGGNRKLQQEREAIFEAGAGDRRQIGLCEIERDSQSKSRLDNESGAALLVPVVPVKPGGGSHLLPAAAAVAPGNLVLIEEV